MLDSDIRHLGQDRVLIIPVHDREVDNHRILVNGMPELLNSLSLEPYIEPEVKIEMPKTVWDEIPPNINVNAVVDSYRKQAQSSGNRKAQTADRRPQQVENSNLAKKPAEKTHLDGKQGSNGNSGKQGANSNGSRKAKANANGKQAQKAPQTK